MGKQKKFHRKLDLTPNFCVREEHERCHLSPRECRCRCHSHRRLAQLEAAANATIAAGRSYHALHPPVYPWRPS